MLAILCMFAVAWWRPTYELARNGISPAGSPSVLRTERSALARDAGGVEGWLAGYFEERHHGMRADG